jgi:hypothetical protein
MARFELRLKQLDAATRHIVPNLGMKFTPDRGCWGGYAAFDCEPVLRIGQLPDNV